MNSEDQKRLVGRLRRIAGQVRALEQTLNARDPEAVTNQMLAVVAATQASLRFYIERAVLAKEALTDAERKLLTQLINRVG